MSFRSRTRAVVFASVMVSGAILGVGSTVAGVVSGSGCADTTTVNTALVSGIDINTSLLLGSLQCGTGDQEVYNYVAVVINDAKDIGGAGIFSCFADGEFANLPGTDAGSLNFGIWIYAYTYAQFTAANAGGQLQRAVNIMNGVNEADGSFTTIPINSVPDGGTKFGTFPAALSYICTTASTWVSTCSAASQPGIQFLAACQPLALEPSNHGNCNLPVLLPEAGTLPVPDARRD